MTIKGSQIEMEERICAGGCGVKFRVMKGSTCIYAKSLCSTRCNRINANKEAPKWRAFVHYYRERPK
jgi:predicted nucleic acid-binding Zn ribbon protein